MPAVGRASVTHDGGVLVGSGGPNTLGDMTLDTDAPSTTRSRREVALALRDVRERTLLLIRPLSEDALELVYDRPEYRVLRGGSWATRPAVASNTFRNWDYPIRRQIFAGLRLARDV